MAEFGNALRLALLVVLAAGVVPAGEPAPGGPVAGTGGAAAAAGAEDDEARRKEKEAALRAEIEKLVKDLGDEAWDVREAAQKRLREIGAPAVPAIKEAAKSKDLETATRARALLKELVGQGWLGVEIRDPDQDDRQGRELPENAGVVIARVLDNTPAAKAGMQAGDFIHMVNGQAIKDCANLIETISRIEPGTKAALVLYRNGRKTELNMEIGRRPKEYTAEGRAPPDDGGDAQE